MPNPITAMLWPGEQNFMRFKAVCDDETAPDYTTFLADVRGKLARRNISEDTIWKLAFDPDELASWCRASGCKVDSEGRAQYTAFLADEQRRRAKD